MSPSPDRDPLSRRSPARIVGISFVAIVALGIHLLLGVQTAALWNRIPAPGSETLLPVFHWIMTIGWFVFLVLIIWLWVRLSRLLILLPIAAIAFVVVLMAVADAVAPSSWPLWLI